MSAMRVLEAMARGAGRFGRAASQEGLRDTINPIMAGGAGVGGLAGLGYGAFTPEQDMMSMGVSGAGMGAAGGLGLGAMAKLAQMGRAGAGATFDPMLSELLQQLPPGVKPTQEAMQLAQHFLAIGDVKRAVAVVRGQ